MYTVYIYNYIYVHQYELQFLNNTYCLSMSVLFIWWPVAEYWRVPGILEVDTKMALRFTHNPVQLLGRKHLSDKSAWREAASAGAKRDILDKVFSGCATRNWLFPRVLCTIASDCQRLEWCGVLKSFKHDVVTYRLDWILSTLLPLIQYWWSIQDISTHPVTYCNYIHIYIYIQ